VIIAPDEDAGSQTCLRCDAHVSSRFRRIYVDGEPGRNLPGYYHRVRLAQNRVEVAFPDHTFPREVKNYAGSTAAIAARTSASVASSGTERAGYVLSIDGTP
jgi:hypothetical protein